MVGRQMLRAWAALTTGLREMLSKHETNQMIWEFPQFRTVVKSIGGKRQSQPEGVSIRTPNPPNLVNYSPLPYGEKKIPSPQKS